MANFTAVSLLSSPIGSTPLAAVDDHQLIATMERFEAALRVNGVVSTALGVPLNVLFIWLVVKHSAENMGVYKKVMLLTAAMDICFALMSFAAQPV